MRLVSMILGLSAALLSFSASAQVDAGPAQAPTPAPEPNADAAAPAPTPGADSVANPEAAGARASVMQRLSGRGPSIATAQPSTEVAAGSIAVTIQTRAGDLVPGAEIKIGIMSPGGVREELDGVTGSDGVAYFDDLATGTARSYRVRHVYQGATYASTPFRLPADRGYSVQISQWPTTREERQILQFSGETQLQFVQDRLRVVHHADLMNPFEETYVFPEGGRHIRLPDGFTGFQSQSVMTDQRLTPEDEGFRIEGSIPPGRVRLTWAFDMPIEGSEIDIPLDVLWRTMRYTIVSEARDGMTLAATGFPEAQAAERGAIRVLVTQLQRRPGDEAFDRLEIRLGGIPQPGSFRWFAVGISVLFILLAFRWIGVRGQKDEAVDEVEEQALKDRRDELLSEVGRLDEERETEEIGPQYYADKRSELLTEIAVVLRELGNKDKK